MTERGDTYESCNPSIKGGVQCKGTAALGMLTALSVVLTWLIHFPIFPGAPFLEYDPADIPILIGTFTFGPLADFC